MLRRANKISRNTSGYVGVVWHKRNRKWQAQLKVDGHYVYLGMFDRIEDAAKRVALARKAAAC